MFFLHKYLILLSFCIFFACNTKPLISIPIEALTTSPIPSQLCTSNDGKLVAWVTSKEGASNIYLATGEHFDQTIKVTDYKGDTGIEITELQFSASGSWLFFVRGNRKGESGKTFNPAGNAGNLERKVYCISTIDGTPKLIGFGRSLCVAPHEDGVAYRHDGAIQYADIEKKDVMYKTLIDLEGFEHTLRWSPNGNKLAFLLNKKGRRSIGILDIFSTKYNYSKPSQDFIGELAWSPNGRQLAFIKIPIDATLGMPYRSRLHGNPWSILILDSKTMESREIWKADEGDGSLHHLNQPVGNTQIHWPLEERIVFPWEKTGLLHMYAIDVEDHSVHQITRGEGEVEALSFSMDGNTMYYSSNVNDLNRKHIWKTDVRSGKQTAITQGEKLEFFPIPVNNGIVAYQSTYDTPLWPVYISNSKLKILAKAFKEEPNFPFIKPEQISFQSLDGITSHGILFRPIQQSIATAQPAIIYLHGGSRRQMLLGYHSNEYYHYAYILNQYLASKGYMVLALNFRSGTGYGLNFREAENYGSQGASEVKDLLAAREFLVSRSEVDSNRISLWGGSYGGYLTAHGLAQYSDLFNCGVAIHGIYDWKTALSRYVDLDNLEPSISLSKMESSSPITYLDSWKSPILLIHGSEDRNVSLSQTLQLEKQLNNQKVEVETLILEGEAHDFLLYKTWLNVLKSTEYFIKNK